MAELSLLLAQNAMQNSNTGIAGDGKITKEQTDIKVETMTIGGDNNTI